MISDACPFIGDRRCPLLRIFSQKDSPDEINFVIGPKNFFQMLSTTLPCSPLSLRLVNSPLSTRGSRFCFRSRMQNTSVLVKTRPQSFPRWRALPIFGPLLDDFVQWMHEDHQARTFSDEGAARPWCCPLNDVFDWICARPSFRLRAGLGSHRKAAAQAQRPQEI
jgi:hypothetical protein